MVAWALLSTSRDSDCLCAQAKETRPGHTKIREHVLQGTHVRFFLGQEEQSGHTKVQHIPQDMDYSWTALKNLAPTFAHLSAREYAHAVHHLAFSVRIPTCQPTDDRPK